MKKFILLLAFILISTVKAGTCTSISRTNSASLSVLTSSKYNSDLNTAYTFLNDYDGGCIESGSLESDALNTTQFAPLLKGLQQGCKVIYSNASTVQIDKCIASVNGNFVNTTSATNASFGCSGCSSEVASTSYYVYIQTGSSGTTLTPLILTTAPNNDGYDNSGNKVVGRFYNNGSSDIEQYSIDQWTTNSFKPDASGWVDCGLVAADFNGFGTPTNILDLCKRDGGDLLINLKFTAGTSTAAEARVLLKIGGRPLVIASTATTLSTVGSYFTSATNGENGGSVLISPSNSYLNFGRKGTFGTALTSALIAGQGDGAGTDEVLLTGETLSLSARIPILGWGE